MQLHSLRYITISRKAKQSKAAQSGDILSLVTEIKSAIFKKDNADNNSRKGKKKRKVGERVKQVLSHLLCNESKKRSLKQMCRHVNCVLRLGRTGTPSNCRPLWGASRRAHSSDGRIYRCSPAACGTRWRENVSANLHFSANVPNPHGPSTPTSCSFGRQSQAYHRVFSGDRTSSPHSV